MITRDNNLQSLPGWKQHDGGNIGGVPPKLTLDQQLSPFAIFHTEGSQVKGGYPDVDWYLGRPLQPNTGNLSLSYDLTVDNNGANVQARERDVRIEKDGWDYNFSFQIVDSVGGKLQISGQGGGWQDIGYSIPALDPSVVHRFACIYSFNFAAHSYSYVGIFIDGVWYPIPARAQNLQAQNLGWTDGAVVQFQQDLTAAAGDAGLGYSEEVTNLNLTWW